MISGNKFYYGVVESRADPLKLGRCKVRVMGIHTENTVLLPTKDLPWAFPLQPITSAGVSGIGFSPTGPVEGTWVICIFRDEGSFQEPIMLGTIGGIPEEKEQKLSDQYSGTSGTRYEGLKDITSIESDENNSSSGNVKNGSGNTDKDGSGNPVLDGSGNPVLDGSGNPVLDGSGNPVLDGSGNPVLDGSGNPVKTKTGNVLNQVDGVPILTKEQKADYKVGEITGKHESNGRIDAINDYKNKAAGDLGGASYGKYQLASYMGADGPKSSRANDSPVKRFVNGSQYKQDFAGLVPGTSAFDTKWKQVAARDPKGFEDAQRQFIANNNYTPTLNGLRKDGIDLTGRGPAVQEMVFSTGTQYGSSRVIKRALSGKNVAAMSDAEIIAAVQDDKIKNVDSDFKSSSQNIRDGVKKRAEREKARLTEMAGDDGPIAKDDVEAIKKKQQGGNKDSDATKESTTSGKARAIPASGVTDARTIEQNDKPGFQDPFNVYPRKKWLNEQDVSRLARNEKTDQTIVKAKEQTLIKGVGTAGGGSWDEPKSPYAAKYPLNHVYQSESGHTVEYDDTPDAERIHIYHRAGSFVEFHPDGTVVYKSVKDQFEVTVADRNIYVGGTCNITVMGDTNIYSKGVLNMESDGDMTIKTGSNLHIGAEGQAFIISDGDMHVGSSGNLHEGARNILMNCSWFPQNISAGDYAVGKITVEVYDDDEEVPVQSAESEAEAIQAGRASGAIPPASQASPPAKQPDGTMKSTQTEPDPETEKLEKTEPDKKETKCPGDDAKGSDQISTNYKLADLTTSPVLSKVALKEQGGMTKCDIFDNLSALAKNVLEPIRARYGNEFIITSAFRDMGSNGKSQHPKGQAVDIQFPGLAKEQYVHRIQEISKILPAFDQVILEYHGRNPVIHISYNTNGNRSQKKTTPNLSQYFSGFRDQSMGLVYP